MAKIRSYKGKERPITTTTVFKRRNKKKADSERRPLRRIRIPPWGKEYRTDAGKITCTHRLAIRSFSSRCCCWDTICYICGGLSLWRASTRWRFCSHDVPLLVDTSYAQTVNKTVHALFARVSQSGLTCFMKRLNFGMEFLSISSGLGVCHERQALSSSRGTPKGFRRRVWSEERRFFTYLSDSCMYILLLRREEIL